MLLPEFSDSVLRKAGRNELRTKPVLVYIPSYGRYFEVVAVGDATEINPANSSQLVLVADTQPCTP